MSLSRKDAVWPPERAVHLLELCESSCEVSMATGARIKTHLCPFLLQPVQHFILHQIQSYLRHHFAKITQNIISCFQLAFLMDHYFMHLNTNGNLAFTMFLVCFRGFEEGRGSVYTEK